MDDLLIRGALLGDGSGADSQCADRGRGRSRRVFDLPGGAPRLHTDAVGVHGVWVNGEQVADDPMACARMRHWRAT